MGGYVYQLRAATVPNWPALRRIRAQRREIRRAGRFLSSVLRVATGRADPPERDWAWPPRGSVR